MDTHTTRMTREDIKMKGKSKDIPANDSETANGHFLNPVPRIPLEAHYEPEMHNHSAVILRYLRRKVVDLAEQVLWVDQASFLREA